MIKYPLSLRAQLMIWLFAPLFVLWFVSSATAYLVTIDFANRPYDIALAERAQSLGARLRLESDDWRFGRTPRVARKNLTEGGDKLFYAVSEPDGRALAGNAEFPKPSPLSFAKSNRVFSDGELNGERIRIVAIRYVPDMQQPDDYVLLQVAETVHKRQALTRGILAHIIIPQMLLIILAVVAVWYALRRGLAPLERLRQEVAQRPKEDLSLLDEEKAPAEMRPLIQAVNGLLQRLSQVVNSQKRFITDAAHQLRTPFAGLKTQAELALREDDPNRVRHGLQQILSCAERCSRLVNQLLSLARNEPRAHPVSSFTILDLGQLARKCAMLWVPDALNRGIDFGFEGAETRVLIKGDAVSLTEMMSNLVDNAVHHTQPGGKVTLSVGQEAEHAVLRVEDNGPGIPPEHREHVFERFYRILGSSSEGSGLGLAIVGEVVEMHGAQITLADGANGHGTLFTIRFHSAGGEQE